ncbi:MAG: DEAD/DEAH box helicase family protein [Ignavibacteriales bacterium]|nr:MAG: DEAD/DEAH box helicase family protein [Ignavibacteriales bacterium]
MAAANISEKETRYSIIDPLLKKAEWNLADHTQVGFEIPVQNYDKTRVTGFTDYCLYRTNGEVLAVVEAKKTSRDPRVGQQQVLDYVTEIEKKQSFRPFAFMSNGETTFFWDSIDLSERQVAGFFSRKNLERLLHIKKNKKPLGSIKIKESIVNRSYQAEAIRRIAEAVDDKKKRKALLVMATGTGKTRTIMALIDVMLQANAAQKILFLADRDSLVNQALTDGFKTHLPNESRTRLRTYNITKDERVYVTTLQTLELCYDKFTPADFDVIISDECHRSIYNKFTDVLAYFDAIQIGLTATPAEFIERDTFKFFDCEGKSPTFLYPFDDAVKEGYLVDFDVYSAQTHFQRKGIKGVDLTEEEKSILRTNGIDPDELNFEGTDLEKKVTNKDTLRAQWEEFMDNCLKDKSGQFPGKSIVFAVTHNHAMRLAETFNEMFPQYPNLIQVIDSKMERADTLLEKFKKESMPRIAISVDMLDTGVDIPEIVNLAFMKPVNSQIKFWQMIGRGTRNNEACKVYDWLPNGKKENFLIIDYWENFEKVKIDDTNRQIPIRVTIFNTRLAKLQLFLGEQENPDTKRIIKDLRSDIADIPLESFSVKKVYKEVKDAWQNDFWNYITRDKIEFLKLKVAPLLRFVPGINNDEAFFISKMERAGLHFLQRKDLTTLIESVKEDISLLPTNLTQVAQHIRVINDVLTNRFLQEADLAKIDEIKETLAPIMKYKQSRPSLVIELGLDDIIESRKWVIVRKDNEKVYIEEYRKRVEQKIFELADKHSAIIKLKKGEELSIDDLLDLENTLSKELKAEEISLDEENMLKAYGVKVGSFVDFLKHALNIEKIPSYEDIVKKAFDAFILEHNYNADQSRFLRAVQNVFVQRRKLEPADLYEEPFTNFGKDAVDKLFTEEDVNELVELTRKLVA